MYSNDGAHFHPDEQGVLRRCYHKCRHWLSPSFLAGWLVASTITFFPEHTLWEKIWPFYRLTDWMESLHHAPVWVSAVVLLCWVVAIPLGIYYSVKD